MRVPPVVLLVVWVAAGLVLVVVEWLAWTRAALVHHWTGELQTLYGLAPVPWWGWADKHLHVLIALYCTVWLGGFCRLFAPRAGLWLPPALMAVVGLADEFMQRGAGERSFEWFDLAAEGVGILLAIPLLIFLARLAVGARR